MRSSPWLASFVSICPVGCHPDDLEIACAGTLLKCKARGDRVVICHLSSGNLGHVIIPPDELVQIRAKEAVMDRDLLQSNGPSRCCIPMRARCISHASNFSSHL